MYIANRDWQDISWHPFSYLNTYHKFLRAVIFKVFTVNWPSAKLSSLQNFGLLQLESKIHMKWLPVFDTCKGWLHASSLPAAATEAILEVITSLATSLRLWTMVEAVDHGWGCGPWLRLTTTLFSLFCMTPVVDYDISWR